MLTLHGFSGLEHRLWAQGVWDHILALLLTSHFLGQGSYFLSAGFRSLKWG